MLDLIFYIRRTSLALVVFFFVNFVRLGVREDRVLDAQVLFLLRVERGLREEKVPQTLAVERRLVYSQPVFHLKLESDM